MKRNFGIIAVMLIIAALTIAVSYTIAQDGEKKDEPTQTAPNKDSLNVAYVNMLEVIKEYDEWKYELEELNKQKEDYQKRLTEDENKLIDTYKNLQESAEPNPELFKKWKEDKKKLEYFKKLWEMKLQDEFRKMFKKIYNQVYDAIIEYANEHKYDVVLGVSEREINVGTEAEFLQKVTLRTVIVYPKTNEITQDVINKLNPQSETPEKPANAENPAEEKAPENAPEEKKPETPAEGEGN